MTAAHIRSVARTGARLGALTSALVVLGAVPAGAVTGQGSALSAGCVRGDDGKVTCTYTSATATPITVHVPANVTGALMTLRGGAGGDGAFVFAPQPQLSGTTPGGAGGTASATVPVLAGHDLLVSVGGAGQAGADGGAGGVGGGAGGKGTALVVPGVFVFAGGGGGGGSEVRVVGTDPATVNPLIAAGGGGGAGSGFAVFQEGDAGGTTGGSGGGATGGAASALDLTGEFGGVAGGGAGGTQTAGGAGGQLLPADAGSFAGADGKRGTGGDASDSPLEGLAPGTGAGGGGGGYYGGGGGSLFTGGGGGSGFGPSGTTFGTGPAPTTPPAPFAAAAVPDGEVVIVFDAPEPEQQGAGQPVCGVSTTIAVSDRIPLSPLGC
jgi:hypothetical protein